MQTIDLDLGPFLNLSWQTKKEKREVVKGDRQRPLQPVFETKLSNPDQIRLQLFSFALAATLPIVLTQ